MNVKMKTIALLLILSISGFAADPFKLTILDSRSAPIPGALVFIRWDPAGKGVGVKQDLLLKTNAGGHVIADLPAGFYDVFVSATAFVPMCRKIRLGITPARTLTLRMQADSMADQPEARPSRKR